MEGQFQNYQPSENDIANQLAATKAIASSPNQPDFTDNQSDDQNADNYDSYPETDYPENYSPDYQLNQDEQAQAATDMAVARQMETRQIQQTITTLGSELNSLEKDLSNFKNSSLGGFLAIFQPRINVLIEILIEQMKRQVHKLSDEVKVRFLDGLVSTVSSLIALLSGLKIFAAFLDAAFLSRYSSFRLAFVTAETIVIPVILIVISPIYVPILAIFFLIGKIPVLKGRLTDSILQLIEKLKKQRDLWQEELNSTKKRLTLRKQIKDLKKMGKQIAR